MTTAMVSGRSLGEIEVVAARLMRGSLSENTWRQYRVSCAHFADWCMQHGIGPMPASPATICLYLADIADRYTVSTIEARRAAIASAHRAAGYPSPLAHEQVRRVWEGIRRSKGVAERRKHALVTDQIALMVSALPDTLKGKRDRALILIGFAGAFRRGELMAISVSDCVFSTRGVTITLRRSKTDQEAQGYVKGIPYGKNPETCPVRALRAWLNVAAIEEGPVWRSMRHGSVQHRSISDRDVARVVKAAADLAGLKGDYSGLSLRAGFATAAVEAGLSIPSIMRQTGHKQVATLMKYVRHASVWQDNPAEMIGL